MASHCSWDRDKMLWPITKCLEGKQPEFRIAGMADSHCIQTLNSPWETAGRGSEGRDHLGREVDGIGVNSG